MPTLRTACAYLAAIALAGCSGNTAPTGDGGPDVGSVDSGGTGDSSAMDGRAGDAAVDVVDASDVTLDATVLDVGGDVGNDSGDAAASDAVATDAVDVALPPDVTDVQIGTDAADVPDAADASRADAGRIPLNHRPDDTACTLPAPPGNCTSTGLGSCAVDSDCSGGANGRCIEPTHGARVCSCSYDTCAGDSSCASGSTCACHGTADTFGQGNTCTLSGCRVDSDCGANGFCSPTQGTTNCGALIGYFCHTANDQCIDDSDCTGSTGFRVCGYVSANSRWECIALQLCP